jgi:hypothetical protein
MMKTKPIHTAGVAALAHAGSMTPPTPAELAVFARAISSERGRESLYKRERRPLIYWNDDEILEAVFLWSMWQRHIADACKKVNSRWRELETNDANEVFITIDDAMKSLETMNIKTFKKWFIGASVWNIFPPINDEDADYREKRIAEEWGNLEKRGTIGTRKVEIMREVRDAIASNRARKAGKAKAARKKSAVNSI